MENVFLNIDSNTFINLFRVYSNYIDQMCEQSGRIVPPGVWKDIPEILGLFICSVKAWKLRVFSFCWCR